MTQISRKIEWDMGHRVPDHQSLCRNLHGHRYVAEVTIEGAVIEERGNPENGMVRDFGVLKEVLCCPISYWDHGLMLYKGDAWLSTLKELDTRIIEVDFIPTAENIAADLCEYVKQSFGSGIKSCQVTVWETPNCKATVRTLAQS